jgi:hypothetical protein
MQVNVEHAQTESSRADNVVQNEIDKFEQMKLTGIKVIHFYPRYILIGWKLSNLSKYLEIFN